MSHPNRQAAHKSAGNEATYDPLFHVEFCRLLSLD